MKMNECIYSMMHLNDSFHSFWYYQTKLEIDQFVVMGWCPQEMYGQDFCVKILGVFHYNHKCINNSLLFAILDLKDNTISRRVLFVLINSNKVQTIICIVQPFLDIIKRVHQCDIKVESNLKCKHSLNVFRLIKIKLIFSKRVSIFYFITH